MRACLCTALIVAGCASAPRDGRALLGPVTAFCDTELGLLACSQAGVARVDVEPAALVCAPDLRVVALAWSSRTQTLFFAGGIPGESGVVVAWHAGRETTRVELADDLIVALALDDELGTLHCGCDDGRVVEIDAATLRERGTPRTHGGPAHALARHGALLASAGHDGLVRVGTSDDREPLVLRDHAAPVLALAWSFDGGVLASAARDGRVRCHDETGRLLASTSVLGTPITSLAAVHGTKHFVAGAADGRCWFVGPDGSTEPIVSERGEPIAAVFVTATAIWIGRRGRVERRPF